MAFADLFDAYPNRNQELRHVARRAFEFGQTIAQEPSAGLSSGLDVHAIVRQKGYIAAIKVAVENVHAHPIPDLPVVHPTQFPIDLKPEYLQFVEDIDGNKVPINEHTQLLCQSWMTLAVELARSQSAALAGSLTDPDYARAVNNIAVIEQLVNEIETVPAVDLPETALPGAPLAAPGTRKK